MQRFFLGGGGVPFSHLCHLISCNVKKNLTDSDLLFPEKAESLPQDQKKKYAEKVCNERETETDRQRETVKRIQIFFGRILNSFELAEDRG